MYRVALKTVFKHPLTLAYIILAVFFAASLGFTHHVENRSIAQNRGLITEIHVDEKRLETSQKRIEYVNKIGTHGSCVSRNQLRNGIISFIEETATRSRAIAITTIKSPTATHAQKVVAERSLSDVRRFLREAVVKLPLEKCPKA